MADLKPIGSEKLNGDDKLKRILELTYYNNQNNKPSSTPKNAEYISETINGTYGIVKEKDGYYVKKGLNEDSLDYIGGMFMKNKNRFSSYSEALKRLELLKGQELLQEETKYVLKVNKPAAAPQTEAPVAPAPPSPGDDTGGLPPSGDGSDIGGLGDAPTPGDDTGLPPDGQGMGEDEHLKVIQKLTGKLGQKLRDYSDKLESDDLKYVLNSIISAIDINKLEDGAKEEILSKFDPEDEDGMGGESPEGMGNPESHGLGGDENEMGEESSLDALETLVNTPFESDDEDGDDEYRDMFKFDVDEEDYNQETKDEMGNYDEDPDLYEMGEDDQTGEEPTSHVKEVSLDELTNMINQTVKERLGKYFE